MTHPKKRRKSAREKFYVLVRGTSVVSINWFEHGKKGVYVDEKPEPGDRIISVIRRERRRAKR
jgi:hypothetical protein